MKKKIHENEHNNCKNTDRITSNKDRTQVPRGVQSVFYSPDYILKKIFRKDGPVLGSRFDSLPENAFSGPKCRSAKSTSKKRCHAYQENRNAIKRRKVCESTSLGSQLVIQNSTPVKKHGKGKGLMAVLQATNVNASGRLTDVNFGKEDLCPKTVSISNKQHADKKKQRDQTNRNGILNGTMTHRHQICNQHNASDKKHGKGKGLMAVWQLTSYGHKDFPMEVDFVDRPLCPMPISASKKPPEREKKKRVQRKSVAKKLKELQDKRKPLLRRKPESLKPGKVRQQRKEKCQFVMEGGRCLEHLNQFSMLPDDEELELRELQAGPHPLTCSAHFTSDPVHVCSFCKALLAKFPPECVAMKQPFYMQPWNSSPELVKKLFKVFHFLCTYAARLHIYSFTIDEFAQAFQDKDSLLLGKINTTLLRVLLCDVETELSNGFFPHSMKNSKFLGLLDSVKGENLILNFWKRSLNPMTWTEIFRQVLIAAGYGLNHGTSPSGALGKEVSLMSKYGLRPGTLKGELFSILSLQGNNGMKVSELAKSTSIVRLNHASTTDELELLISSVLSSDITLFEKIGSSAYRLRINSVTQRRESDQSDLDDFGSVDDDSENGSRYSTSDNSEDGSSSDDSEFESRKSSPSNLKLRNPHQSKRDIIAIDTEIDESLPGEVWLLGLTEGEYFDLSIDEKLNALVALIDLLSAGSTIRLEDALLSVVESAPELNRINSGGKIKRSMAKQHHTEQTLCFIEANKGSLREPLDSLVINGKDKSSNKNNDSNVIEFDEDVHPMQSIYLGSDRRFNRYWLFMGPCSDYDPGHKRIYFESSEDGQWEVIDTAESLCTLLSTLDRRGSREAYLLSSLEKLEAPLHQAMSSTPDNAGSRQQIASDCSDLCTPREDSSSAVSDIDNNICLSEIGNGHPVFTVPNVLETEKSRKQKQEWSRLQAFDSWVWKLFYLELNAVKFGKKSFLDSLARCEHCHDLYWRDEKHCKVCHTTFELDFDTEERYAVHAATCRKSVDSNVFSKHKVLPSQLQSLKAAIYAIESVMPEDALVCTWTKSAHNIWSKRLRRTSSLVEFFQVLADFVTSINEDWLHGCNSAYGSVSQIEEIIACFATMPQTLSAAALWVVKLDDLIGPYLQSIHTEKFKQLSTTSKGKKAPVREKYQISTSYRRLVACNFIPVPTTR
ncbi:homeobox-DDT domain protein RLT3 [Heracleum sosnowskyi]|uniref:Homeobox-DDT domain protein RLT3 n=1 Tax=Heracleum sosnowskyi TaxID=360622 RepID=A0AAD8MZN4_9APIA|nr:homeobox-DDT domain protein RLT3 [Heracleum sosnowskyi]